MIPLRDLLPTYTRPVVTWSIVGINAIVFLVVASDLDAAARALGAVPYHFTGMEPEVVAGRDAFGNVYRLEPVPRDPFFMARVMTHMWAHAGLLHLLGNMWFLWIFGDNVEDRLGRVRYLLLYLASGLVAMVGQMIANPASGIPMIGASGAVSGILGAYLRLFPKAQVLTLVPLGFLLMTFVWSARVFLGIWIAMQLVPALLDDGGGGGVAWWAHIGGFVLGWAVAPFLAPPILTRPGRDHRPWDRIAGADPQS